MELLKPISLLFLLYLKGKLEESIHFISHGSSLIQTQQIKKVFPFPDKKG